MKKIALCLLLSTSALSWAQTATDRKLSEGIQKLQTANSIADYDKTLNLFSNLRAEYGTENHWLSFYYTAFSAYKQADILLNQNPNTNVCSFLGLAIKAGNAAHSNTDNAETNALMGLIQIANAKGCDTSSQPSLMEEAKKYLQKAEQFDAKNPRVLLLKGKILASTPENEGGNKTEAKKIFEQILQQKTTPSRKILNWGKKEAKEATNKL